MKKYIIILIICLLNIPLFSQNADKFLLKAGLLAEQKKYNDALSAINLTATKESKMYTKVLADINYGLKNYSQATDLYNSLEKSSPGSYQIELARCAAMEGNMPKAMDHLNLYFQQNNKIPISKIISDDGFSKYKGNQQWENMWQKIDYSELELKINQVSAAFLNGDLNYLNSLLDEALKKHPNNSELLYYQSKYFFDKQMLSAAEKSINQALAQKSNDKYFYQKSITLQKNGNSKEALNAINDALNRNPLNLNYYLTRIELNRALGNTDKADEDLRFINFSLPENTEVQLAQIQTEADKGNYMNAIDGLNTLIERDKNNKELYLMRGKMSLKVQKLQDADEDFGMALDLNPMDADANLGKGIAKYKLDDTSAACYYWQKASNLGNREAMGYLTKFCNK